MRTTSTLMTSIYMLLLIAMLLGTTDAIAQGGATYTAFGIGDIERSNSAAYDGAAGTAVTRSSGYAINSVNPAAWADLKYTTVQTGFIFRQHSNTDRFYNIDQFNGQLQGVNIGFAIDTTIGISMALGLRPASVVRYSSIRTQQANFGTLPLTATTQYDGSGGISQAFLGGAFRPFPELSVGASVLYNFGRIRSLYTTSFSDATFLPATADISDQLGGLGAQAGILYSPSPLATIGIAIKTPVDMNVTRRRVYSRLSVPDTSETSESSFSLPLILTAGAAINIGTMQYALEVETADYSTMNYRLPEDGTPFGNSLRIALGASRPLSDNPDAGFFERMALHTGVGYQQHYYRPFGNTVQEYFASFGIQTPVSYSSYFDAAVTAGIRGSESAGLVRELFMRLSFSVTVGETWFIPFYRE